jgi:hypothetical protein
MSYRVTSNHVESLHDGRMVEPGATISDADAKKNPRLVKRRALSRQPDQRKKAQNKRGAAAATPASEQENEEVSQ